MGQHKYKQPGEYKNPGSDQWLTEGKCEECRRKAYCSVPCKANVKRTRALFLEFLKKKGYAPPGAIDTPYNL